MKRKNKICFELVFTKETNSSRAGKITDFWKFIDSQNQIQPYKLENNSKSKMLNIFNF